MRSTTRIDGRTAAAVLLASAGALAWLAAPSAAVVAPAVAPPLAPESPPAPPSPARGEPAPLPGSALGLILYGISGGSADPAAVIGSEATGQRLVRAGRDFRPGVTLGEVGPDHVVLVADGRPARLELRRFGGPSVESAPARSDPEKASGIESAVLRNILRPIVSNGRVGGYALKGGETLPRLQQAGLRAGDVILRVNGSPLDEERMGELAWEMRNATRTEFEFVREGKRMRARL